MLACYVAMFFYVALYIVAVWLDAWLICCLVNVWWHGGVVLRAACLGARGGPSRPGRSTHDGYIQRVAVSSPRVHDTMTP